MFEGVAKAFNEQVKPHDDLVALCKKFFGTDDLNSPKLKLAFVSILLKQIKIK